MGIATSESLKKKNEEGLVEMSCPQNVKGCYYFQPDHVVFEISLVVASISSIHVVSLRPENHIIFVAKYFYKIEDIL